MSVYTNAQPKARAWTNTWRLASTPLRLTTTCYGSTAGVIFVNVHENEVTSVKAGKHHLSTIRKHCLVELQHNLVRLIRFVHKRKTFQIDPNRIFTEEGVRKTLELHNPSFSADELRLVRRLGERFTASWIDNKTAVVALHNNGDSAYSINFYVENPKEAAAVFVNQKRDPDDFFFTTERPYFDFLQKRGYNVVLQHNELAEDDGSLSIYCARKRIPYINIEAQEGHLEQQKEMLAVLHELLESQIQPM